MNRQLWWVVTMVDKCESAMDLSKGAVSSGLATCAQIEGPVTSIYVWKGQQRQDPENRIVFKCTEKIVPVLMDWLKEQHPYEVPEILAWPVSRADPDYQKWAEEG